MNTKKYGTWAVITGASSGIGKEFARQLASQGFNLVLIARRLTLLKELGMALSDKFTIQHIVLDTDLSGSDFIEKIDSATHHLDVGLLVSNAGTGKPGSFLSFSKDELRSNIELNAVSHLLLSHYFGGRMKDRRNGGGIILVSAMGAPEGIPYMAVEASAKALVSSLGKGLHTEFKKYAIDLTVLMTSPTETPVLEKLGFSPENLPLKPVSTEVCVTETLRALSRNKLLIIPGLKYRLLNNFVPPFISRHMMASLLRKNNNKIE